MNSWKKISLEETSKEFQRVYKFLNENPKKDIDLSIIFEIPEIKERYNKMIEYDKTIDKKELEETNEATIVIEYLKKIKACNIDKNKVIDYNKIIEKSKKVFIITGYPASGKSTISDKISSKFHARLVDSDEVKKFIPEYKNGLGVDVVHVKSKFILNKIIKKCIKNCENMVYPVIGDDYDKLLRKVNTFAKEGYEINIICMHLEKNITMSRVMSRYLETGRMLMPTLIYNRNDPVETFNKVKENIKSNMLVHINFNTLTLYNNDVPFGTKPKLVEKEQIINNSFLNIEDELFN